MQKKIRDIITYGGLALAGYALLNKVATPAAAAPSTAGLGDPNHPHPFARHPAHPYWRSFQPSADANESTFGPGQWAYSNWDMYGPWGMYGGGYGGESTFGGGSYWDYEPVTYEQGGSLEARAAENY